MACYPTLFYRLVPALAKIGKTLHFRRWLSLGCLRGQVVVGDIWTMRWRSVSETELNFSSSGKGANPLPKKANFADFCSRALRKSCLFKAGELARDLQRPRQSGERSASSGA